MARPTSTDPRDGSEPDAGDSTPAATPSTPAPVDEEDQAPVPDQEDEIPGDDGGFFDFLS